MAELHSFQIRTVSMVSKAGLQRVDVIYDCSEPMHLLLDVYRAGTAVVKKTPVAFNGGKGTVSLMLPVQGETFDALWTLTDRQGKKITEITAPWTQPRERTMYVMISSHTDIGLHNSQYIQRYNSSRFLDMAKKLCDETDSREKHDRYRYTMEGTWFWNNYGMDRGRPAAEALLRDYVKSEKLNICCGVAGNHTQVYGLEELCRSAYEKKRLQEDWGVESETMTMIDNNGMSPGLIQPYAEAGVKNIIFAPNQWNPLPSTLWKMDHTKTAATWNPDAGGGGARIDIRYSSQLPMVFYWENEEHERILVWGSTQYTHGGAAFGLVPEKPTSRAIMEDKMAEQLPELDEKYPYDVWLMCCYADDQEPDLKVANHIMAWNEKWQWPKLRTLGDPGEPFRILREKHDAQIPVVRGDIAGGWYQHPVTTPELLAQKFAVDRLLPTAEKWSVVAGTVDESYAYPATAFRRAWDYLLYNDEHSYGTSGYEGRRVYETWMQHRDWIDKAEQTARQETASALQAIAANIGTDTDSIAVFNPTALQRRELVEADGKHCLVDVPPLGYRVVAADAFCDGKPTVEEPSAPPVIENRFYRLSFAQNGTLCSIFDKELDRELLEDASRGNELLYTKDNHKTFTTPENATFAIFRDANKTTVIAKTREQSLGAEIVQSVSIPEHEKRIDIDNRLYHVKDMVNKDRYYRYLYYAFPFAVESCRRYCHLNGTVAEYGVDVTGHGTDVYMAVNEWCCAENSDFGVALLMLDSQLMEFDHIHPDKTDVGDTGDGSRMFAYLANDWLQMHTPGGSHLDYRFRYCITSYTGGYRKAGISQLAERYANPVQPMPIPKQDGTLNGTAHSFLKVNQRLIGLKRADDGDGIIARVYGDGDTVFETDLGKARRVRIDESPLASAPETKGFATYRIGGIQLKERPVEVRQGQQGAPAPIGSVYTGLITEPCAAAGENAGHLYLLWGQSTEEDFSHYKLYRSETPGFTADEHTFLADVQPEEYRVGRYEDTGLKEHTCYYYRVCAVNQKGQCSELSREFSGITKESLE